MNEIAEAFEEYLRSLTDEHWNALQQRVRGPSTVEMVDAQIASDPQMLATLHAQAQALESAIAALDAQIAAAQQAGNTTLSIMSKQERYRLQLALSTVQADYDDRRRQATADPSKGDSR